MKKSSKSSKQDFNHQITKLEANLDIYFNKKAPQLPKGLKEFIVWITPYLTFLGALAAVPFILGLLGISVFLAPLAMISGSLGFRGLISLVAFFVVSVLYVTAIPGLFAHKKKAWDKLFWVSLIHVVTGIISMNLFGLVVGTAINWYILFQIRSYYK